MSTPTLRAAIYAPYSTDKQTESSIADQVRVCTEWAKRERLKIGEVFKDKGISSAAVGNRPGFLSMMEAAQCGAFARAEPPRAPESATSTPSSSRNTRSARCRIRWS